MTALPTIGILSAKFTAHSLKTKVSDHALEEGKKNIYCHSICNATCRVSFTIKLIPSCNVPPTKELLNY